MKKVLFRSSNLIGDALYISPGLNLWHKTNPEYEISFQTNPDHVAPIYERMGVPVASTFTYAREGEGFDLEHTFDVGDAFKLCDEKKIHIAEAYAELLGLKLEPKPDNQHLKPIFIPTPEPLEEELKGLILVSMFSASCASRQRQRPNKMLPWPTWRIILRYLRTLDIPIRFVGGPRDRVQGLDISEEEYLLGVPLNKTALIMQRAKLLVALDNGMSHLGASQDTPTFLFYPACLGLHYILPKGNKNLAYLHMDPMTLHPVQVVTIMKQTVPLMFRKE